MFSLGVIVWFIMWVITDLSAVAVGQTLRTGARGLALLRAVRFRASCLKTTPPRLQVSVSFSVKWGIKKQIYLLHRTT